MNAAIEQFRMRRWKQGIACAFCMGQRYRNHGTRPSGVRRYRCLACKRIFSDASGTFLESSKIPFEKWFQAAQFFTHAKNFLPSRNLSARLLRRRLKVSYPTALHMFYSLQRAARFRELQKKSRNLASLQHYENFGKSCAELLFD